MGVGIMLKLNVDVFVTINMIVYADNPVQLLLFVGFWVYLVSFFSFLNLFQVLHI